MDPNGPGRVLKGMWTGWGGHLHHIGGFWGVPYVAPNTTSVMGKVHGDTKAFDDLKDSLHGKWNIRMKELRVLHDSKLIFGIQAIYEADGQHIEAPIHHGPLSHGVVNQSVQLPEGTFIVGVAGRGGDVYDQFSVKLNNGTQYVFGGSGGDPWHIDFDAGHHLIAIAGGFGGHIHNLRFYT
jgi:hypothetical protein